MTTEHGSVRHEAERLVAEVLTRLGAAGAAGGLQPAYDPQRAQRVAQAAGDVAVAVTGLLRELSRPGPDGTDGVAGLRGDFVRFAGGLIEAAGVDLHAAPQAPQRQPRQDDAEGDPWRSATRHAAAADADPWRAATWADGQAARRTATEPGSTATPPSTADARTWGRADAERKSHQ
ncbi:MAG: hypothetical protein ACRDTU_13295 [Micromonosporaceae bacterium]